MSKKENNYEVHPDLPEVKYRIGQVVWQARSVWSPKIIKCKVCAGLGTVNAKIPRKKSYVNIKCPECNGTRSIISEDYSFHSHVKKLTIGSIQIDTYRQTVKYMMNETGVGSGTLYYQDELFSTEEEAIKDSKEKIKAAN